MKFAQKPVPDKGKAAPSAFTTSVLVGGLALLGGCTSGKPPVKDVVAMATPKTVQKTVKTGDNIATLGSDATVVRISTGPIYDAGVDIIVATRAFLSETSATVISLPYGENWRISDFALGFDINAEKGTKPGTAIITVTSLSAL